MKKTGMIISRFAILKEKKSVNTSTENEPFYYLTAPDGITFDKEPYRCIPFRDINEFIDETKYANDYTKLAKDEDWGEVVDDYQTQIVPLKDEYRLDAPINFRIFIRNNRDHVRWFDLQVFWGIHSS